MRVSQRIQRRAPSAIRSSLGLAGKRLATALLFPQATAVSIGSGEACFVTGGSWQPRQGRGATARPERRASDETSCAEETVGWTDAVGVGVRVAVKRWDPNALCF